MGIRRHDAYIGWTIVSRTEHNVEFAQGKTITGIVGIGFVKDVANARTSQAWDVHEISVAPGRRRDDHHEQCEYLYNSAIQHSASHALASYAAAFDGLHCVRCNSSCSTNSSTERTRIEKPQEVHFDCRKKTSLCTTGFRVKSYSLNSIGHSFGQSAGRRSGADLSASVRRLVLAIALTQYTCQKCGSRNSFPSHLSQAIRV